MTVGQFGHTYLVSLSVCGAAVRARARRRRGAGAAAGGAGARGRSVRWPAARTAGRPPRGGSAGSAGTTRTPAAAARCWRAPPRPRRCPPHYYSILNIHNLFRLDCLNRIKTKTYYLAFAHWSVCAELKKNT